ncbi:MAG: phosphodiester glycosidase family protein [Acidobacteria bacterium]|nr:phosphodiester glycosidase family protein [Acidobacteriota bacterium]HCA59894.1 hypothetical protein [Blastocatellia bacterium]
MRSASKLKEAIIFVHPLILVSVFCVLCASVVKLAAQDWKAVHDGVEYAQVEHKIGKDPVKINLLRLDLTKVRLDVHKALDKAIGLETTSSIANRKGAVAAINAGFFRLDKSEFAGDSAGVLMIDGKLLSESTDNRVGAIIGTFRKSGFVFFGHLNAYTQLYFGERSVTHSFQLSGTNRQLNKDEAVVYDSFFGPFTPPNKDGVNISLGRCKRGKRVNTFSTFTCSRYSIVTKSSGTSIPRGGFVLSVGPDFFNQVDPSITKLHKVLVSGRNLAFQIKETIDSRGSYNIDKNFDVVNGVPQLIKDGKIDITWEEEKASRAFVFNRHPRTAVAKLKDGKFLMVTVDGRQPGVSVGMTLQELAEYLLSLGAVDAMNLDGGGSTTMVLDGKVVNKPSDPTGERKIGDAIVVTLRKPARQASRKN